MANGKTNAAQAQLVPREPEPAAITPIAMTPVELLRIAVTQGADVDKLEKLIELQLKWEANESRKAFDQALAAFKANPPKLEKVKEVNFPSKSGGNVKYSYAPLDYICSTIGAALSSHGLSFTWNVDQSNPEGVKVTCILRHASGHYESVMVSSGLHDDTRMNAIQRLGSTITYLERYSLLAATGLATADQDTDGMTMNNAADFIANIETSANLEELGARYREAVKSALSAKDPNAVKVFMKAREKRERELAAA